MFGSSGHASVSPKQWATFHFSDVDLDLKSAKCGNVTFQQFIPSVIRPVYLSVGIWNITCARPAVINIEQSFKFVVFNTAPVTYFGKRAEDPPWHGGHNRIDIAEFGPKDFQISDSDSFIQQSFGSFIVAQLYREVATMN